MYNFTHCYRLVCVHNSIGYQNQWYWIYITMDSLVLRVTSIIWINGTNFSCSKNFGTLYSFFNSIWGNFLSVYQFLHRIPFIVVTNNIRKLVGVIIIVRKILIVLRSSYAWKQSLAFWEIVIIVNGTKIESLCMIWMFKHMCLVTGHIKMEILASCIYHISVHLLLLEETILCFPLMIHYEFTIAIFMHSNFF